MKIDEPKTPYVQGSETGSSTSGSARTSPPESPSFIPGERLVGFRSLEASMNGPGTSSDGASSTGSAGRSVQIMEDVGLSSGGSSPKSKEIFAARRKAHYRNEFRARKDFRMDDDDEDDNDNDDDNGDVEDEEDGEAARHERAPNSRSLSQQWDATLPNGYHEVDNGAANGFEDGTDTTDATIATTMPNGHADGNEPAVHYAEQVSTETTEPHVSNAPNDAADDSFTNPQSSDHASAY